MRTVLVAKWTMGINKWLLKKFVCKEFSKIVNLFTLEHVVNISNIHFCKVAKSKSRSLKVFFPSEMPYFPKKGNKSVKLTG